MSRAPGKQLAPKVTREARGRVPGDGIELSFGYWPGRGAPIVALHGLTASYVNFIGIAERLLGRRPLFALDLRGRGDSDKPDGPYGLAQHARDVAAAMRALDLGPSVIVGHSMGAFIATALAEQNPELVAGLILIDGGYLLDMPAGADTEQILDTVLAQRITQLQETYPSREVYREFWRTRPNFPAADWGPWTEKFLDYEVDGEAPSLRPKASEAAVRFDVAESFRTADITARLESLRVPVMLLRAEAGFALDRPQLIPDSAVSQMRKFLPQLEEETIPGTTHYTIVLGERGASRVADVIAEFTQRCESKMK
ncbi:MAG TPA: alpha/beta hydrolase [Pyrinomonadaceae bacterium]|nr:alpha/beta hydrolase [Pyrinomonadaceae bacterium]